MGKRPSPGRSQSERGLDQFDTPPIALGPLFEHEPLLAGVTTVVEPFCGLGNLVIAMRARGLVVHASDIQDRGCPDSTVIDFLAMTERPASCDVLLSNPPYAKTMKIIEHAWALGFRLIVFLLQTSFVHTADRFERMHKTGRLRRIHVLAERLLDMHDANFTGEKASQSQVHAWFVFDRDYCGPATINPVSIHRPATRMPWLRDRAIHCDRCGKRYEPRRPHRGSARRLAGSAHITRGLALRLALRPRLKCFAMFGTPMSRGSRRKAGSCCLRSMAHTTVNIPA